MVFIEIGLPSSAGGLLDGSQKAFTLWIFDKFTWLDQHGLRLGEGKPRRSSQNNSI
jgi:hypothetical protein